MDRVLCRKLEILRLCQRDPDDERLYHTMDSSRKRSVNIWILILFHSII